MVNMAEEKKKKADQIAVRIGTGGRVVIPAQSLQAKGVQEGDIVLLDLKKAKVTEEEVKKER